MQQHDIEKQCMGFTSSLLESQDSEVQDEEMNFQKIVHKRMGKSGVIIFIPNRDVFRRGAMAP